MHAVTYEHGLHLMGTPLWFDAERRRELCIVMGLGEQPPAPHSRLLTSAAMADALERLGHGAGVLPTPWQRWVGVGGHRVQLIDAEAAPGCSAALVMAGDAPLLVTGTLRAEPAAWPRAGHVVARLPALRHSGAPLGEVATDVMALVDLHQSRKRRIGSEHALTIWVDSLEVGLALHNTLLARRCALRPLGLLGKLTACTTTSTGPVYLALALPGEGYGPGAIRIDSGLGFWPPGGTVNDESPCLPVRWYADLTALQKVLAQSGARRVSLVNVPPSLHTAVRCALGPQISTHFLSDARQLPLKVTHPAVF